MKLRSLEDVVENPDLRDLLVVAVTHRVPQHPLVRADLWVNGEVVSRPPKCSPEMWQVMRMSAFGKARSCGYPIGASLCASVFFFAVPNANAAVSADFGNPSTFPTGSNPVSVALGDLNRDGDLDMVSANAGSNDVSVLLGTGNGSFGAKSDFAVGTSPKGVALGDMNGDGIADIVAVNAGSNNVSVLWELATGASGPHRTSRLP